MTPAPLSAERLEDIRERESKATPGPWRASKNRGYTDDYVRTLHPDHQQKPHGCHIAEVSFAAGHAKQNFSQDAEFIAHARTDVVDLINFVYQLQARVRELEDALQKS